MEQLFSETMEATSSLKRKPTVVTTVVERCLFCQRDNKNEVTREGRVDSIERVRIAYKHRRQYGDDKNDELLDRLDNLRSWDEHFIWHKNCYSMFTSEEKLSRLQKKHRKDSEYAEIPCDRKVLRRSLSCSSVNWSLCLFCQTLCKDVELRNVTTFNMSNNILNMAKDDIDLSLQLAGVSDLIAAEGKYHLKCYSSFTRKMNQLNKETPTGDRSFKKLVHELRYALARGDVFKMNIVWERYVDITKQFGDQPQQKYTSRRGSFKEDLADVLGKDADFVRPLEQNKPLIIFPTAYSKNAILKLSNEQDVEENRCMLNKSSVPEDEETDFFRSMFHVIMKVRNDLKDAPEHRSWVGIDEKHVKDIIPESLFLLLRLPFEGETILDSDETRTGSKHIQTRKWVYSIAQDIIYGVSGGRKLTPKHIGIGMTVHQATRSKLLVDLLHESCHSVSYEMVRRIDTSISECIAEKFLEDGNVFIPRGIKPNVFAHFSVDNIDILEDTLDGKNTFHATQMAVWQRGPPRVTEGDLHQIGMEKVLKHPALNEMNKIQSVIMPKTKPEPSLNIIAPQYESIIDFKNNRESPSSKDLAWLMARTENDGAQHVPGWSGFNKMISSVCPEITTAGLLPIIQQPAHEYDTLNTVIIRCMDISKALGQKHTVITADQALYCKLKELVWFKANEYQNVIIRLGGLHIMMNFIQCIGKHMECSGLEDIWTEADLFGENTIHTIMSGKAYNRAVRAHKLTYEALWRVLWLQLKEWLHDRGEQISVSVTKSAKDVILAFDDGDKNTILEKVEILSKEINGFPQIRQFEEENASNHTFVFWRAYMRMVNILLDFLRAERDGNWNLHVSSFTRMLHFCLYMTIQTMPDGDRCIC